ncbi:peptidase M61 [Flavobacterium salilacus subsp. salilacus]|uniref:M61 family metallopeptidase n=1 Tax=Flavobacterium TaxID=237 RepID=UPI001074A32A|nr:MULTISPECIES: peptidase M61 [Flavobacterium]KAF2519734.1 peptidase M61 [Flavobacterium salilacus subsp. salilacus]MBE1614376.1 peptidase M61 [Flavobacterium sp. SaA2.13]
MKQFIYSFAFTVLAFSNVTAQKNDDVKVAIDLKTITNDKVTVTVTPPAFKTNSTTYFIPKIVPGTYSADNYGKFIENFKAYDKKGRALEVVKADDNSWKIDNAKKLVKITYEVNDTYDTEGTGAHEIFSPAGTNIVANENFVLNTHGFIGYFEDMGELPYELTITHPATLWGATSFVDTNDSNEIDVFNAPRYPEVVDHPIMYSKPDYTSFMVDGMEILISVYSPTGKVTAKDITPEMETMMRAQKRFLGAINSTKKYSVLVYLSDIEGNDAKGFGALEHTTSTTVVMPEAMPLEQLLSSLKDVVSHEFFHIVTPLSVHSKEIHFFNYNTPKMSEHLWMYEGVTEYFANLFQVNQGLITEEEFYIRMAEKVAQSKQFDETMNFTKMSKNILEAPYKDAYYNVYLKGALIAMCIDIEMRESSNGEKGILDLMQALSNEYGSNKPFNDEDLFTKITALSYPAVGEFLNTYVAGSTPIPYDEYFAKMGVTKAIVEKPGNPFLKNEQTPYVTINAAKEIVILPNIEGNTFMSSLGIQAGDALLSVNDTAYNLDNIYDLIMNSMSWKEGEPITVTIKRDEKEQVLNGKVQLPTEEIEGYQSGNDVKVQLRESWLKG